MLEHQCSKNEANIEPAGNASQPHWSFRHAMTKLTWAMNSGGTGAWEHCRRNVSAAENGNNQNALISSVHPCPKPPAIKTGNRTSWGGCHQDLFKSASQGPVQDHAKTSDSISPGSLRESHKIVMEGPAAAGADLTRSWYKNPQEPPTRAFIQAPLKHGICKLLLHGPFIREDLTRIST